MPAIVSCPLVFLVTSCFRVLSLPGSSGHFWISVSLADEATILASLGLESET